MFDNVPADFHADPSSHPRWLDQMDLEVDMLHLGVQRFRQLSADARAAQEETRLRPVRQLLNRFVEPVAVEIRDFIEKSRKKRGVRPIALDYLMGMDAEAIAYLTLKVVLDEIGRDRRALTHVAHKVATSLMNEARMAKWAAENPALFGTIERRLTHDNVSKEHRKTVLKHAFNKLAREALGWSDWPPEHRLHVGIKAVELLVKGTKRFTLKRVHMRGITPYMLEPDPETMEWLLRALKRSEVLNPVRLPTLIPPRRWRGLQGGGYYSQVIKPLTLIRHKGLTDKDRKKRQAFMEKVLEEGGFATSFQALNALQETPWAINKRVLEVAEMWWDREYPLSGMPPKSGRPMPARPSDLDTNPESLKAYKWATREVKRENSELVQKTVVVEQTLHLAKRFADKAPIYFPHNLDFRGRIYPITSGLSPQGGDLALGLLTFHEGQRIDNWEQGGWLAIHVANCWGLQKVSYEDRIQWCADNEEMLRSIAADPLADRRWNDADAGDAPWQFLAACIEYVAFLDHGFGYVSALPVRVDGTCNGLQHLSAMLRDEVGGRATNLIGGDKPADIYQEVADKVTVRLHELAGGHDSLSIFARLWLKVCSDAVPRSLTKRPVMILPYGGTLMACRQYIEDWLKDQQTENSIALLDLEDYQAALTCMTNAVWAAIQATVQAAPKVMAWLRECAKLATKSQEPLTWITPAGFPVWHKYTADKVRRRKLVFEGVKVQIDEMVSTDQIDSAEQARGIAPNFVHSMDAAALMLCIVDANSQGVSHFTAIHDSFGSTAAAMDTLTDSLRRAFYLMYEEHDVLEEFAATVKPLTEDGGIPAPLHKGSLDLAEVLKSPYFFG